MTLTFRGAASLGRAIGQDPRQPRQGQDSVLPKAGAILSSPRLFPAVRTWLFHKSCGVKGASLEIAAQPEDRWPVGSHLSPLSSRPRKETVSSTDGLGVVRPQGIRETVQPGLLYASFPLSAAELLGTLLFPGAFGPPP